MKRKKDIRSKCVKKEWRTDGEFYCHYMNKHTLNNKINCHLKFSTTYKQGNSKMGNMVIYGTCRKEWLWLQSLEGEEERGKGSRKIEGEEKVKRVQGVIHGEWHREDREGAMVPSKKEKYHLNDNMMREYPCVSPSEDGTMVQHLIFSCQWKKNGKSWTLMSEDT